MHLRLKDGSHISWMPYKSNSPESFSIVFEIELIYLEWITFLIMENQTNSSSYLFDKLLIYKFFMWNENNKQ